MLHIWSIQDTFDDVSVGNVTVGVTPGVLRKLYNVNSVVGHDATNAQVRKVWCDVISPCYHQEYHYVH